MTTIGTAVVSLVVGCVLASSIAYGDDAAKCEAAKLKIAGKYSFCRVNAEAQAVRTGGARDYSKCDAKFSQKWMNAETNGNGMCPTAGDAASIQTRITTDSGDLAVLLSGGSVSVCGNWVVESGEECDLGNLNGQTCQTQGFFGGQLSCTVGTCVFNTSGCFATRFVDNGDGTVTDHQTGLQWEKKDNLDSTANTADPHDADNTYTWTASGTEPDGTAYTDFLAKLNNGNSIDGTTITGCFAGHCDWRLPTSAELQTILLAAYPCATSPCIDPAFGPTQSNFYWSATTNAGLFPFNFAWYVNFFDGYFYFDIMTDGSYTRAVRTAP
jgi:hypothetical protein